jgi:hypothetical protein
MSNTALANQSYAVKRGDTLSDIVRSHFPNEKLYGLSGKLAEILRLNPQIKNPNLIYPKQQLNLNMPHTNSLADDDKLERVIIIDEAEAIVPVPENLSETRGSSSKDLSHWKVSLLYGAKNLSIAQKGDLGSGDVGVLYFNHIRLNSEFVFNKWSLGFQYDSYDLKYKALAKTHREKLHGLFLYGTYGWMLAGLHFEQNPLFRNSGTEVDMIRMTPMYLSIGAKKEFSFSSKKETTLTLKGWVGYPLSINSDSSDAKLSGLKGFAANGQIELNRQIFSRPAYSLHATWLTGVGYRSLDQTVKWGNSEGDVTSRIFDASSNLGLLFKF